MKPRLLIFVLLGLAGCGYCPPLPPPLDLADYRQRIDMTLEEPGEDARVGILGVRLARRGFYLDLIVHAKRGDTIEQSINRAGRLVVQFSMYPERLIEITDIEERPIRVQQIRYPFRPSFFTGTTVFRAHPPTYHLDDHRLIKVCMIRTAHQLSPGVYRLRFSERWKTNDLAALARPFTYEWEQVEIQWPTRQGGGRQSDQ